MKREQMAGWNIRPVQNWFDCSMIVVFAAVMMLSGYEIVRSLMGIPVWSLWTKYVCFVAGAINIAALVLKMRTKARRRLNVAVRIRVESTGAQP